MLYSSSKEDLKRNLGAGYFKTEFSANVLADVTWDSYLGSLERGLDSDLLTETERLVLEEKVSIFRDASFQLIPILFYTNRRPQ